jgi:hypothetical protein
MQQDWWSWEVTRCAVPATAPPIATAWPSEDERRSKNEGADGLSEDKGAQGGDGGGRRFHCEGAESGRRHQGCDVTKIHLHVFIGTSG